MAGTLWLVVPIVKYSRQFFWLDHVIGLQENEFSGREIK
jgi:hypothetical protein